MTVKGPGVRIPHIPPGDSMKKSTKRFLVVLLVVLSFIGLALCGTIRPLGHVDQPDEVVAGISESNG